MRLAIPTISIRPRLGQKTNLASLRDHLSKNESRLGKEWPEDMIKMALELSLTTQAFAEATKVYAAKNVEKANMLALAAKLAADSASFVSTEFEGEWISNEEMDAAFSGEDLTIDDDLIFQQQGQCLDPTLAWDPGIDPFFES